MRLSVGTIGSRIETAGPSLGSGGKHRVAKISLSRFRSRSLAAVVALFAMFAPAAGAEAGNYVGLGDSYTAGPVIPIQLPPFGCLKSSNNYPHLAASELGLPLRDASCSGARTAHMTQPQGVTPGPNPPQFDSLDEGATVVTLTIGGNDIGFSSIAQDCVSQSPTGSPCQAKYVVGGRDEVSARIAAAAPKVASVLQGIRARSPNAKVYLLNYIAILPDSGPGCWPQMPIADGDVPWVRAKQKELNAMLADQAASNGAGVIDWYTPSIGHDACQLPGIKWVEGPAPMNAAAPVHPNLLGMIAMSRSVVAAVRSG